MEVLISYTYTSSFSMRSIWLVIALIPIDRFALMVDGIWMNIEVKRRNMIDSTPLEVGDHRLHKVLDNVFNIILLAIDIFK
jgi:hypothetical protein